MAAAAAAAIYTLGAEAMQVLEMRNTEAELMPFIKAGLHRAQFALMKAAEMGVAETNPEVQSIILAADKLAATHCEALQGAGEQVNECSWMIRVKSAFGKYAVPLRRELDELDKQVHLLFSALQLRSAEVPRSDPLHAEVPSNERLEDVGILVTGAAKCPCCNQRFDSDDTCMIHQMHAHPDVKFDGQSKMYFSKLDFGVYYRSWYPKLTDEQIEERWERFDQVHYKACTGVDAASDADLSTQILTAAEELWSVATDEVSQPEINWCLETTLQQMQHDEQHRELVCDSLHSDNPDGIAQELSIAVKTQQNVLSNVQSKLDEQKEKLIDMRNLLVEVSNAGLYGLKLEDEDVTKRCAECLEDSDRLAVKLTEFVKQVLDNTGDISGMLIHMRQGVDMFKMLQQEALKSEPSEKLLGKFASLAYTHLKKSQMTDEYREKLSQQMQDGTLLCQAAAEAQTRLEDFAGIWDAWYSNYEAQKQEAVEKILYERWQALRWKAQGITGLVALCLVGAAVWVFGPACLVGAACSAQTGGLLAIVQGLSAAKASACIAGHAAVIAAVFGIGYGAACWQNSADATEEKKLQVRKLALEKIESLEETAKLGAQKLIANASRVAKEIKDIVAERQDLMDRIHKAESQAEVLKSHLQFMSKKHIPLLEPLEDADADTQVLVLLVRAVPEADFQDAISEINNVQAANEKLRQLALGHFEDKVSGKRVLLQPNSVFH